MIPMVLSSHTQSRHGHFQLSIIIVHNIFYFIFFKNDALMYTSIENFYPILILLFFYNF